MDKKNDEKSEFTEPAFEDFLVEEVDPHSEQKKKRRSIMIRSVAMIIAFMFLISSFSSFSSIFNLPAFHFVKTSYQLSKQKDIQQYKKAVVSVEGSDSKGTGFNIVADGYIITNYHVIEKMKPILVYFPDGQVFKATLVHGYPEVDLAFLDIKGKNLPVLPLGRDSRLTEGDSVYVIGNPLGYYQIANQGEMIGYEVVEKIEAPILALTAPIFRGNSGSPVINKEGKVVGVVFATTVPKLTKRENPEGLAIPIREVLTRLPK
ncbi:S1C family serine protease [Bacillus sp. 1NLA3E]|uniref:S1C family serine protease n=1 Tax=Bacillus sp. 1NLA3E TaxID=666686 RepID=UPI000247EDAC|nr:serine protease [Bacillus sp. 1NLA3E]AGK54136.1 trypsin-like serine protease, typically periplasmic, containing C-terminal PDZ domain [Bacillus sp. 1NLA3E]